MHYLVLRTLCTQSLVTITTTFFDKCFYNPQKNFTTHLHVIGVCVGHISVGGGMRERKRKKNKSSFSEFHKYLTHYPENCLKCLTEKRATFFLALSSCVKSTRKNIPIKLSSVFCH